MNVTCHYKRDSTTPTTELISGANPSPADRPGPLNHESHTGTHLDEVAVIGREWVWWSSPTWHF